MKTIIQQRMRIIIVFTASMFFSSICSSQKNDYHTLGDGDYFKINNWSKNYKNEPCGCFPDDDGVGNIRVPANSSINIHNVCFANCNISIGENSEFIIAPGKGFLSSGSIFLTQNAILRIEANSSLKIEGDLLVDTNAFVINNGKLTIGGNLYFRHPSSICDWNYLKIKGKILNAFPYLPCPNSFPSGLVSSEEWPDAHFANDNDENEINYSILKNDNDKAIGESSTFFLNYSEIEEGKSFYRLKQTDYDGNFEYSSIIVVNNVEKKEWFSVFFPNPFKGEINVSYSGLDKEIEFVLKNYQGTTVFKDNFNFNSNGMEKIPVNTKDKLGKGLYLCSLLINGSMFTNKIMIN